MNPDWFTPPQPDWPPNTINTGFPLFDEGDEDELSDEVQHFLDEGNPPVAFMPGSLMQQGDQFFRESQIVCEKLSIRAIFLTRYADQVPEQLPATIKHFAYVPFSRLLPHIILLVHHGGIGTTAQALRAGIPQLIHPMAYDQYDNAARLKKIGVGTSIKPDDYTAATVAEVLRYLMTSNDIKQCCADVASRFIDKQPIEDTCDIIERLLP
jgi:UDP:flavonoid glycosyltransferase YjiC (YdhE family)